MTYVIAQPCVDLKDKACVDECPVDCIYEGARMLYIHPDECVDCGACEPVCPVEAIYYEDDTPEKWMDFHRANVDFFDNLGSPGGAAKRAGSSGTTHSSRRSRRHPSSDGRAVTVVELDRVVIRFAGDSGDGMQTDRRTVHPETAELRQRPRHAAELPGRDPRSPGHAARRLELPAALRQPRHPHARRSTGRPGRDEPGGAEGQPRRPDRAAATLIVDTDDFTTRNLAKVGYDDEPAGRRQPRRLPASTRSTLTALTVERGARRRTGTQGRRAVQEHVRAGPAVLAVPPADRGDRGSSSSASSRKRPDLARRTSRRSRPAGTTARRPRASRSPTR